MWQSGECVTLKKHFLGSSSVGQNKSVINVRGYRKQCSKSPLLLMFDDDVVDQPTDPVEMVQQEGWHKIVVYPRG